VVIDFSVFLHPWPRAIVGRSGPEILFPLRYPLDLAGVLQLTAEDTSTQRWAMHRSSLQGIAAFNRGYATSAVNRTLGAAAEI
jgi:hypothetical protein